MTAMLSKPSTTFEPTKPYWELSREEKTKLKEEAQALRHTVDNPKTDWVQRERAAARLAEIEGRLRADSFGRRQREQVGNRDGAPRLIRSDDGGSFMLINASLDDLVR